jgi:hypothetical protein
MSVHAIVEHSEFALIWPVFPTRHQSGLDRVFGNIKPFLAIAFTIAKLPVEKILLPDWFPNHARPATRHISTPKFHPPFEWSNWNLHWRAEKMQVIRHDDIAPHQPVIRFAPCFDEQLMDFRVRKQRTAAIHVATDILYDCLVGEFQRRQMRQLFSTRFWQRLVHNFRRDELRESLTLIKHNVFHFGGTSYTSP